MLTGLEVSGFPPVVRAACRFWGQGFAWVRGESKVNGLRVGGGGGVAGCYHWRRRGLEARQKTLNPKP